MRILTRKRHKRQTLIPEGDRGVLEEYDNFFASIYSPNGFLAGSVGCTRDIRSLPRAVRSSYEDCTSRFRINGQEKTFGAATGLRQGSCCRLSCSCISMYLQLPGSACPYRDIWSRDVGVDRKK